MATRKAPAKRRSRPIYLLVSFLEFEGPERVQLFRSRVAAERAAEGTSLSVVGPLVEGQWKSLYYGG